MEKRERQAISFYALVEHIQMIEMMNVLIETKHVISN